MITPDICTIADLSPSSCYLLNWRKNNPGVLMTRIKLISKLYTFVVLIKGGLLTSHIMYYSGEPMRALGLIILMAVNTWERRYLRLSQCHRFWVLHV